MEKERAGFRRRSGWGVRRGGGNATAGGVAQRVRTIEEGSRNTFASALEQNGRNWVSIAIHDSTLADQKTVAAPRWNVFDKMAFRVWRTIFARFNVYSGSSVSSVSATSGSMEL